MYFSGTVYQYYILNKRAAGSSEIFVTPPQSTMSCSKKILTSKLKNLDLIKGEEFV
jgi:hypothetical protein